MDLKKITESAEYRNALGLPPEKTEEYELYAHGEYNLNYSFVHPLSGRKMLLRVNCGSQMHLENQISYEANALRLLRSSGRTPELIYVDDSRKYIDHGILVETMFDGFCPDIGNDEDVSACIECLADVHCTGIDRQELIYCDPASVSADNTRLIAPTDSYASLFSECEKMFAVYDGSDLADLHVSSFINNMLDHGRKRLEKMKSETGPRPYSCCVNTDTNFENYVVDKKENGITAYLVDWEKPLYDDPAHDIGHMLAPTTTFWKTDVLFSSEYTDELIDRYISCADGRFDTAGLKERVYNYIDLTCLRGITWSAMAWTQYRLRNKEIINADTAVKLEQYLSEAFLEDIAGRLRIT